jgi:hypothetical protein
MGGSMMGGQGNTMMGRGAMRLSADHTTVPHGTVSFLVTNDGSRLRSKSYRGAGLQHAVKA